MAEIASEENQNIEYKESWRDEYLKWICGFANAQGGRIYIGVDDKREVVGVSDSKRLMEDIPNKIVTMLGIVAEVNLHEADGKQYIEIVVEMSSVPISYHGIYHYRSGSTKQELKGVALQEFILRKLGRQWDDIIHPTAILDDIDIAAINYFVKKGIQAKRLSEAAIGDAPVEVLRNLHLMTDDGQLKNAAILLFAKEPQKYFAGVQFKIGRFGADESDLKFQDLVEGNILQMADKVIEILKGKYLKSPIHYEGMQRIEPLEIPEDALRELLYNAIVHKQYGGAPIQMKVFDDHIELWNEGQLPSGYTIDTLWEKHLSRPRNMNIANAFNKAGFIEAWGRGYRKIREEFEAERMEIPSCEVMCGGLLVTIKRPDLELTFRDGGNSGGNSGGNVAVMQLTEKQKRIYHLIAASADITAKQMAVILDIPLRTVERELASLQRNGIIRHEGKSRTGHWVILK